MKKRKLISFLATAVLLSQPLSAKKVELWGIPHYAQISNLNCGMAVSRMWIHYLNHGRNVPIENDIENIWYVGKGNGLGIRQMEWVLERYTGKGFQRRNVRKYYKRIYEEFRKQHRPIAISAATRYRGHGREGIIKPGQHWMLMWAADVKGKGSGYKPKWVKLHDPLFLSAYQNRFYVINMWYRVNRDHLNRKVWVKIPEWGKRQLIED